MTFTKYTLYGQNSIFADKLFFELFLKIGQCINGNKDVVSRCIQQLFI